MSKEQAVTEEQAGEALKSLLSGQSEAYNYEPEPQPDPPTDQEPDGPEPPLATESGDGEVVSDSGDDDLDSLKSRLQAFEQEREKESQEAQERLAAIQSRNQENERILRDKFLKKSTAADYARQVLQKSLADEGASQEEVRRALEQLQGTLNPASPNYAPPPQPYQQYQQQSRAQYGMDPEDVQMSMNTFLNEKGMSPQEASNFGNWLRVEAAGTMSQVEQGIAHQNLDAFLRIAHTRWLESENQKTQAHGDAVRAVKSVQRTQKAAQRATSGRPSAPVKTRGSAPEKSIDEITKEFTHEDVGRLLKQAMDQYR